MSKYVAAIDQGTTSTRFMIFDHGGNVIAVDQKEHEQIYPKPGWVEHDPLEIWERTQEVMNGALEKSGVSSKDIAAIGITNQRETTVVWDKNTGKPIYNAIVWQDTRTDVIINELAQDGRTRSLQTHDRPASFHLFFWSKAEMDSRQRGRRARQSRQTVTCYSAISIHGSSGT